MDFQEFINTFGLYLTTLMVCFSSGIIPIVNAEAYLVSISAFSPKSVVLPLILVATLGQMIAKLLIYIAGCGVLKFPRRKVEKRTNFDTVIEKFEKWEDKIHLFIFISAFTGFPPFYVVSVLAGISKLNVVRFFVFGFFGRLLRFSIVVLFPQIIKGYMQ